MQINIPYKEIIDNKIKISWLENKKIKTSRTLQRFEAAKLIQLLRWSNDVNKKSIRIKHISWKHN